MLKIVGMILSFCNVVAETISHIIIFVVGSFSNPRQISALSLPKKETIALAKEQRGSLPFQPPSPDGRESPVSSQTAGRNYPDRMGFAVRYPT